MIITPLSIAKTWIGTKELPGKLNNPIVIGWIHTAGGVWVEDDEIAWCSAFVYTMVKQCGGPLPTKGLGARQWLTVGKTINIEAAKPGWDVVIFKRGKGEQPGPEVIDAPGHVAFFDHMVMKQVLCVGGNQNNMVCEMLYPISRIIGVRRLWEIAS